jgi:rare lipoprotein A
MRPTHFLLPLLVMTTGCAASTYPLNPQLAAQVGLPEDGGVSFTERAGKDPGVSFTERVGRDPDGAGPILQVGSCSWYGPGFHGRRTSNGEVFDTHALTAAHPTLPFGSELEVTNIKSGKSVRVRVNDRGPFIHNRILDLSYAAANSIGLVKTGTADVQIRLVDVEDAKWPAKTYALEVASFTSKAEADRFIGGLSKSQRAAGLYYVKSPDGVVKDYRVRFGPFTCEKSANSAASKLRRNGLKPALTHEDLTAGPTKTASLSN